MIKPFHIWNPLPKRMRKNTIEYVLREVLKKFSINLNIFKYIFVI